MTTQQQEEQLDNPQAMARRRWLSQRTLAISTVVMIVVAITVVWILSSLKIIPGTWASIISIIITVLGVLFAFLQSIHVFVPANRHAPHEPTIPATSPSPHTPPIILQVPATQPLTIQLPPPVTPSHRHILGFPPPTDPRTIQQREHVVKEV